MSSDKFVEYTFFCTSCGNYVSGVGISRISMTHDNDCYNCRTPWEKVIVTRKIDDGIRE